jgi:hypothetical protein
MIARLRDCAIARARKQLFFLYWHVLLIKLIEPISAIKFQITSLPKKQNSIARLNNKLINFAEQMVINPVER